MKRLACIDVGSGSLELLIAESDGGKVRVLEALRQESMLGRDCYARGTISRDAIRETCMTLSGYRALIEEYRVDRVSVAATSAMREAANRDWVLDQIALTTGFEVEVLSNAQERGLILAALREVPGYDRLRQDGVLVIDVGYGSTEISEVRRGEITFSRNIKIGALRLWELIASIADGNARYPDILEQYITAELQHIRKLVNWKEIRHCIALSGEADRLIGMMQAHPTLKRFNQLYIEAKSRTPEQLERVWGVSRERVEILLPTMMVIKAFLEMTRAEALDLYGATLKDGMMFALRDTIFHPDAASKAGNRDKLSMARWLASSQGADMAHARDVERQSVMLFDALKDLHGMGTRERLLLRLAATMHDMGKRISTFEHGAQSAQILLANPIVGLSDEELTVVACIAEYHSMRRMPSDATSYQRLSDKNRIYAVKLLAILLLADAMDAGYHQKLSIETARIKEERFVITARAQSDAVFEGWVFEKKAVLFAEVFGLRAELKIKRE